MPYIGRNHVAGDHTSNFKVLDDISSYTATFNGSSASIVSTADETIRIPEHRFVQGQRVTYSNGGGGNIGGLTNGTAYFVTFDTANTLKLATSLANANNNTNINLSSVGSGSSHTLTAAFDGVNTTFKITHGGGSSAGIVNSAQLQIAINNVIQKANLDSTYTEGFLVVDSRKIQFKTAPTADDIFWGNIIANTIETFDIADLKVDNFTGDGTTTQFTLSRPVPNNESIMVTIDGVLQHPSDKDTTRAYRVLSESVIEFSSPPPNPCDIQVRHLGFAGAATGEVSGFYGRTGNVVLGASDHITTGDITPRNINASGIVTASSASFGGNVSIGGTLTYEDVTNIDSVGIITARKNIHVGGTNDIVGTPYNYFYGRGPGGDGISVYAAEPTLELVGTNGGAHAASLLFRTAGNDGIGFNYNPGGNTLELKSFDATGNNFQIHASGSNVSNLKDMLKAVSGGAVELYHNGTKKFETNSEGIKISGDIRVGNASRINIKNDSGSETLARFNNNGAVELYHNNIKRLETSSVGVSIPQDLDVDGHTNLDNVSVAGVTTFSGNTVNVTGELRIENASPLIRFIDSNNDPDYWIQNNNGGLRIRDITNAADRFTVHSDGHVDINGNLDCLSGIDVTGNATVTGDIDVDGHTNLDNVSIAGITTFTNSAGVADFRPIRLEKSGTTGASRIDFLENGTFKGGLTYSHDNNRVELIAMSGNDIVFYSGGNLTTRINSSGHVVPGTDSTYDLGLTGTRWRNVYADTYYGDGSNLSNITSTTINNNADNRLITGSGTANTLEGEASLTYGGTELLISNASPSVKLNDTDNSGVVDINNVGGAAVYQSTGDTLFETNGNERLRIDSNGKILSGHTAALTKFHGPGSTTKRNPHIQVNGTNVNGASMSLTSWDNNVNGYYGPAIYLAKSGSSTIGTNSRVSNQLSILGSIIFSGDDGDEFVKGAMIQGAVDGGVTTGNNDMPGRLLFLTTKDGGQEPIERLRIDSTGAIMLMQDSNESSAQQKLQWISNSGSLSAQAAWGQGSANFDFSVFRSDSQTDYPYGNFRVLTGGTSPSESLKVTVGGQVLKPRQPAFRAQGNTHYPNQTSDFSLVYNNEIFDRGSNYDPSNGRFTAPVSGRYYFYYCYLVYPDNDNYWKTMGFTINGSSSYAHGFARGDRNSQNSMQVSTFLDLSANDYVQPHIQISSGTLDFYMTGGHAHFYGWLVS